MKFSRWQWYDIQILMNLTFECYVAEYFQEDKFVQIDL